MTYEQGQRRAVELLKLSEMIDHPYVMGGLMGAVPGAILGGMHGASNPAAADVIGGHPVAALIGGAAGGLMSGAAGALLLGPSIDHFRAGLRGQARPMGSHVLGRLQGGLGGAVLGTVPGGMIGHQIGGALGGFSDENDPSFTPEETAGARIGVGLGAIGGAYGGQALNGAFNNALYRAGQGVHSNKQAQEHSMDKQSAERAAQIAYNRGVKIAEDEFLAASEKNAQPWTGGGEVTRPFGLGHNIMQGAAQGGQRLIDVIRGNPQLQSTLMGAGIGAGVGGVGGAVAGGEGNRLKGGLMGAGAGAAVGGGVGAFLGRPGDAGMLGSGSSGTLPPTASQLPPGMDNSGLDPAQAAARARASSVLHNALMD